MRKSLKFCSHAGCRNLTHDKYCEEHAHELVEERKKDWHRGGTAAKRGYNYRWSKYSKWFLQQEGNQFCKLHLDDKCAIMAQCVDHIKPPKGADDPLFWDTSNHQPACIHCNSVKGHTYQVGKFEF